jgi:predicted dehydrogenase
MMVDAVKAGKHVYVEKPLANSIEECRIMMQAARESSQIVQDRTVAAQRQPLRKSD